MDNETFITQDGNSDGHFKSFSLTISISFQSAEKSSSNHETEVVTNSLLIARAESR